MKLQSIAVLTAAVALPLGAFLVVAFTPDAGTPQHPWMLTFEGIGELTTHGTVLQLPYTGPNARQDCERAAAEYDRSKAKNVHCAYEW
jgi:hypothetical protein